MDSGPHGAFEAESRLRALLVAYLLATDNVLRPLACRLSRINQAVLRSCNPFSRPHRTRSAGL
jgi:hypothetical protein